MTWPVDGLRHFNRSEFTHPDQLDTDLLLLLDEARHRVELPFVITSDIRSRAQHTALYLNPLKRPNSPHLRSAIDFKTIPSNFAAKKKVLEVFFELYDEGACPRLGLEFATSHWHIDIDRILRRPHIWPGISK